MKATSDHRSKQSKSIIAVAALALFSSLSVTAMASENCLIENSRGVAKLNTKSWQVCYGAAVTEASNGEKAITWAANVGNKILKGKVNANSDLSAPIAADATEDSTYTCTYTFYKADGSAAEVTKSENLKEKPTQSKPLLFHDVSVEGTSGSDGTAIKSCKAKAETALLKTKFAKVAYYINDGILGLFRTSGIAAKSK